MKSAHSALALTVLVLGACAAPYDGTASGPAGEGVTIPQAVVDIAAPYQDLTTARLRPEDGCYWYLHAGPVETTSLPLRTPDGRQICTSSSPALTG